MSLSDFSILAKNLSERGYPEAFCQGMPVDVRSLSARSGQASSLAPNEDKLFGVKKSNVSEKIFVLLALYIIAGHQIIIFLALYKKHYNLRAMDSMSKASMMSPTA